MNRRVTSPTLGPPPPSKQVQKIILFFFHSTGLGPNSKVISIVMHPHPQGKITPPVTVVLTHIKVLYTTPWNLKASINIRIALVLHVSKYG